MGVNRPCVRSNNSCLLVPHSGWKLAGMQTTVSPNVFNASSEDMPAMIAALLHELTTLRAEVRALTEIVRGRVSKPKFDSFSMAITNKAFEETQEQMNNFGIKIQLVPKS